MSPRPASLLLHGGNVITLDRGSRLAEAVAVRDGRIVAGSTSDTPAPYNCEILKDARGNPDGVFLERNFVPILEYTLFSCLPRFTYEDRVLDAEIPVALGTDGVPISMLWTVWEALARMDGETHQRHGESGLTREEALRLGTQTGHRVTWNEDRYGSIESGKVADLVVLDGNPLTCAQDDLKSLPVRTAAWAEHPAPPPAE